MTSHSFSEAFHVDTEAEGGISFDLTKEDWPLSILFESSYLYAETHIPGAVATEGDSKKWIQFIRSDMYFGFKRIIHVNKVIQPYAAGGMSLVRMLSKKEGNRDTASALGYFAGAGVIFVITKHFSCGIQWKHSWADMAIHDASFDAGGNHLALLAGFSF